MGKCFWCYFRRTFISLAVRKCKKYFTIFNIILEQDFYILKTEIVRFPIGFRLNIVSLLTRQSDKAKCVCCYMYLAFHFFHYLILFEQAKLS